jgi:hypothetical protein
MQMQMKYAFGGRPVVWIIVELNAVRTMPTRVFSRKGFSSASMDHHATQLPCMAKMQARPEAVLLLACVAHPFLLTANETYGPRVRVGTNAWIKCHVNGMHGVSCCTVQLRQAKGFTLLVKPFFSFLFSFFSSTDSSLIGDGAVLVPRLVKLFPVIEKRMKRP